MYPSASEVSVITVNWNGRRHLESLLPSLQTLGAREIIVVDNGSTDDSVAYLRESFPQVRILQNQVNRGFSQPNNLAAEKARGRILALINNDMRCHPDWIEAALPLLHRCPCVGSRILDWSGTRIDYNGSSLQYLGFALQRDIGRLLEDVRSAPDRVLFPCGGAMLIDRSVFLDSGGFDEDFFAIYEDVDLGWRLWSTGHEVRLAEDSIVYHRGHGTFTEHESPKMRYLMHRNALLTIFKNYEEKYFRKIFPLAVMMAVRRAVRLSEVNKKSFYLWSDSEAAATESRRFENFTDAMNHLVALDDVIEELPRLLQKREEVQSRRKRSDDEILQLFNDPLRPIVEERSYLQAEADILSSLNLDSIFDLESHRSRIEKLPDETAEPSTRAGQELRALHYLGVSALLHPPLPGERSRWRQLRSVWRSRGTLETLKLIWKSVWRGVQRNHTHT